MDDIKIYSLSYAEIDEAIKKLYRSERNQDILRDRICNRLTYEELAKKYCPQGEWMTPRQFREFIEKVQGMVKRLVAALQ